MAGLDLHRDRVASQEGGGLAAARLGHRLGDWSHVLVGNPEKDRFFSALSMARCRRCRRPVFAGSLSTFGPALEQACDWDSTH